MKHRWLDRLEYVALRIMTALVNWLPHRAALAVGWIAARIVFHLSSRKMTRAERRIAQVMGREVSPRECRKICWLAWRNLTFNIVESMRTPLITLDWVRKVSEHEEVHVLFESMQDGRGVVLAVPHMGNWELAGVALQLFGAKLMIIVRKQRNMLIYHWLNELRGTAGLESFLRESKCFSGLVKGLRQGKVLAILPDLSAKAQAVNVPFLGHTANIPSGMAAIARASGTPIVPAYVLRIGWARHRLRCLPPIHPDQSLDRDTDIERMTRQVIGIFDQAIRANPDQYYWFNKRWVLGEEPVA